LDQENSAQENSAQENLAQENLAQENLAQENLAQENLAQENFGEENLDQGNLDEGNLDEDRAWPRTENAVIPRRLRGCGRASRAGRRDGAPTGPSPCRKGAPRGFEVANAAGSYWLVLPPRARAWRVRVRAGFR
jgi:hypothetical protein